VGIEYAIFINEIFYFSDSFYIIIVYNK